MNKTHRLIFILVTLFIFNFAQPNCVPVAYAKPEENLLPLTLEEAVTTAIQYNPSIEELRLQWISSKFNAKAAWGDFEPSFVTNFDQDGLNRQNTTLQRLEESFNSNFAEHNTSFGTGVDGKFFSGTNYHVGYSQKHIRNSLTTNEEYQSFLGVTIQQPLLKNLWFGAPIANIQIAEKEYCIAFHNLRKQFMQTIAQTENTYWSLYFAQEQNIVAAQSVEIAKKLLIDSEERFKLGKISDMDLYKARTELDIRVSKQADKYQALLDASSQLALLLSDPKITDSQLIRATSSILVNNIVINEEDSYIQTTLESAYMTQPDYLIRESEVQEASLKLKNYRSKRLPDFNIKGSYGWSGLDTSGSKSWKTMQEANYPAWSVGFEVRIPLLTGIRESNELAAARLGKEIAQQRLNAAQYELTHSLKNLTHRIKSIERQIETSQRVVQYKQHSFKVVLSHFKVGKIDIRKVYEAEEDLSEARNQDLEKKARLREAIIQLKYMAGSILLDEGLEKIINNKPFLSGQLLAGHPKEALSIPAPASSSTANSKTSSDNATND